MVVLKAVGGRLLAARQAARLTQEQVAKRLVVTRQAVSSWERGTHAPSIVEMMSLISLYGVSADHILYGMDSAEVRQMLSAIFKRDGERVSQPAASPHS